MQKINATTKKAQGFIQMYKHARFSTLSEAYARPSVAKQRAYDYCLDLMREYDGEGGRITGRNCMVFSFAFRGTYEGKPALFYITRDYDRVVPLA